GDNYKVRKERILFHFGWMNINFAIRKDELLDIIETRTSCAIGLYEKWERSNHLSVMFIKTKSQNARKFLEEIEQFFDKKEKVKTSNFLAKFISMKYKDKENIMEYIMEMSNLISKLKSLKLKLGKDLLMHLVLISHFAQFKVSYNSQKDKWSFNELISHCVQEEERLYRDKTKIHLTFVPKDTWWVDFGATTPISVTMQDCLWSQQPSDIERFIFVDVFKSFKAEVELNLKRKLKLSNLIMVMNIIVDMMDQENNVYGLLQFFSKSVKLFYNTPCQANLT
ncbi:hypothetical protein CR513_24252, partial [Mucuna pruriens]